ncbi:MAG: CBS domain-containing protein [Bacteroidetes bacterium]|nr:CBS domain-containing protein [Bacteroidota bacterium]
MISVADALKRKNLLPVTVAPGTSVLDALQLMMDKNIGSLVVTNGSLYLGVFTERDYSRKVILCGKSSEFTLVEEIMSQNIPAISITDTIELCMQLMSQHNVRYLPVLEDKKLIGIISMSDVVRETISAQQETIDLLQHYIQS